jgi:hypothetical protein
LGHWANALRLRQETRIPSKIGHFVPENATKRLSKTLPALVAQQPPVSTNEVGSCLPWEQRPLNWGGRDLIFAADSGSGEATDDSAGTASEPVGDLDLLDSYQY